MTPESIKQITGLCGIIVVAVALVLILVPELFMSAEQIAAKHPCERVVK